MPTTAERPLTATEAAEYLRLKTTATLRRLRQRARNPLPSLPRGARHLYLASELLAWMKRERVRGQRDAYCTRASGLGQSGDVDAGGSPGARAAAEPTMRTTPSAPAQAPADLEEGAA